jgi:hypothetical protein
MVVGSTCWSFAFLAQAPWEPIRADSHQDGQHKQASFNKFHILSFAFISFFIAVYQLQLSSSLSIMDVKLRHVVTDLIMVLRAGRIISLCLVYVKRIYSPH